MRAGTTSSLRNGGAPDEGRSLPPPPGDHPGAAVSWAGVGAACADPTAVRDRRQRLPTAGPSVSDGDCPVDWRLDW